MAKAKKIIRAIKRNVTRKAPTPKQLIKQGGFGAAGAIRSVSARGAGKLIGALKSRKTGKVVRIRQTGTNTNRLGLTGRGKPRNDLRRRK